MKKKHLRNKRIVEALTIGISAMMTLQTPFTAYASGEGAVPQTPEPEPQQEAQHSEEETYQPVTEQAQEVAGDAIEAIGDIPSAEEVAKAPAQEEAPSGEQTPSEEQQPQAEEQGQEQQAPASNAITKAETAATNVIENADASDAGKEAGKAISDMIDAARDVVEDSVDEEGNEESSAVNEFDNASDKIADVKENLAEAEKANKEADTIHNKVKNEVREMAESYLAADEQATNMDEVTELAVTTSESLVESIQNAETKEEAQQAYQDLEKLVEQTREDLETRKLLYDQLVKEYEEALQELEQATAALEEAEKRFDSNLDTAKDLTDSAMQDALSAQDKVERLDKAIDAVQDKLQDEKAANALSDAAGDNWNGKFGNVDKNRAVMRKVIANYYMTEVLGIQLAEDINVDEDFESLKGVDGQEYNYTVVKYKYIDKDGNVVDGVKYFNWDSLTRTSLTDSSKFRTGGNDGIVIFEKSEEEIKANEYAKAYYTEHDKNVLKDGNRWKAFLDHKFDVYTYVDENGEKQFILKDEMEKSDNASTIVRDEAGNIIGFDGKELTQVVQNSNSMLHDANCLIIASDKKVEKYLTQKTEVRDMVVNNNGQERLSAQDVQRIMDDASALNAFISNNSSDSDTSAAIIKYVEYKEASKEAKDAAKEAVKQVENLSDALEDIKSQAAGSKRTMLAREVLGQEDLAAYYGIEMSPEEKEAFNNMNVAQLIKEMNRRKAEAGSKVTEAEQRVADIENKYAGAEEDLQKTLDRLAPPPAEDVNPSGGETGPSEGEVTPGGGSETEPGSGEVTPGSGTGSESEAGETTGGSEEGTGTGAEEASGSGSVTPGSGRRADQTPSSETPAAQTPSAAAQQTAEETAPSAAGTVQAQAPSGGTGFVNISDTSEPLAAEAEVSSTGEASQNTAKADGSEVQELEGDQTVVIGDDATPKAAPQEEVTTIGTQEAPLASSIEEVVSTGQARQPVKKSFWWLIIIALLGATGEAMYEKHMAKKEEEQEKTK
jgi:hypothetical protein